MIWILMSVAIICSFIVYTTIKIKTKTNKITFMVIGLLLSVCVAIGPQFLFYSLYIKEEIAICPIDQIIVNDSNDETGIIYDDKNLLNVADNGIPSNAFTKHIIWIDTEEMETKVSSDASSNNSIVLCGYLVDHEDLNPWLTMIYKTGLIKTTVEEIHLS